MPIFSPAAICLPPYEPRDARWTSWAVIACDQFTSEPAYWERVRSLCGGMPSAYDLILPEAYLGTDRETEHRRGISRAMRSAAFCMREDTMVFLVRTLPDGRRRRGLVGKIDLERYDYAAHTDAAIRATEATVTERIPPRVAIRAEATVELPHVMLLSDGLLPLMEHLTAQCADAEPLYDFDLMLGGGHAAGYALEGELLSGVTAALEEYETQRAGGMVYAVGDGNHSLAAAKAHYESLKRTLGEAASCHPARYALVEVVDLREDALCFEPIYRLVTGCCVPELLRAFTEATAAVGDGQTVCAVSGEGELTRTFDHPSHALTVGTLQDFLDGYVKAHPGAACDYIHGEASLRTLARREGAVGFLMDGMPKEALFPYVTAHGALPRKTFSMGEAASKRYYIEARRITR